MYSLGAVVEARARELRQMPQAFQHAIRNRLHALAIGMDHLTNEHGLVLLVELLRENHAALEFLLESE